MNYVREYWERISSGEIVTSKRVKAVYGRLVAEMDAADENSPYYFDEAVGERPITFVERFCKQSQGTLGESLTLELFQKAFIQLLFGWLERATGYRRFRETLFLVGRKNGKSTLLAALALYMLVADYEGAAEIYSVATKKDQAKKTLTEAVNMVKQSPELSAILKKRRNDIYFPATASKFEALASDSNTLDGLNSHAVIIDELHAIRDRNLYEVMKQSTSSRRQPLVIMITTSGTVRESVFDNLYGYACEVADGQTPDERFLPVLYELDKREEWTDPAAWIKANPGLGTIKQYTTLADFVERAKKNPEDLPGVLCKDFNVKATGAASCDTAACSCRWTKRSSSRRWISADARRLGTRSKSPRKRLGILTQSLSANLCWALHARWGAACICVSSRARTATTSLRRPSRRWRVRCATRSPSTPDTATKSPRPKERYYEENGDY